MSQVLGSYKTICNLISDKSHFRKELVATTVQLHLLLDGRFPDDIIGAVRPNKRPSGGETDEKDVGREGSADVEDDEQ